MEFNTTSPQDTQAQAANFAGQILKSGINILLLMQGEYGAGKTTFAQGFAKGLGITTPLLSPSYTYMREYETEKCKLVHIDLWRVKDEQTYSDLIGSISTSINKQLIIVVEWPNLFHQNLLQHFQGKAFECLEITLNWIT